MTLLSAVPGLILLSGVVLNPLPFAAFVGATAVAAFVGVS